MTTQEAARTFFRTMQELRAGKITPDEMRASNRALRDAVGDAGMERAKAIALANDQRALGY